MRQTYWFRIHVLRQKYVVNWNVANVLVIAGSKSHAKQIDSVTCKDEYEDNEKCGNKQNLFEAFTKLTDYSTHMRDQHENS